MLQISQLYIYPVKSLGGIAVSETRITSTGLEHDRRWMLVDKHNVFLSQRTLPQLAHLKLKILPDGLEVYHQQNHLNTLIPFEPATQEFAEVHIWDDVCTGQFVSTEIDQWFTGIIGMECRLVYMPDITHRQVDLRYAAPGQITSFSDAYPFLLISQESLDDLNSRLAESLPMDRFRPNLVFTGAEPYAEDRLAYFVINNIDFYGVKLCARCVMTGVNQNDATTGAEPLRTLSGYRKRNNKIYFGQNLIHAGEGTIKVGDILQVHNQTEIQVFNG